MQVAPDLVVFPGWGEPRTPGTSPCAVCGQPVWWSPRRGRYLDADGATLHLCPDDYLPDPGEYVACFCGADVLRFRDGHKEEWRDGRRSHVCSEPWKPIEYPNRYGVDDGDYGDDAPPDAVAPRLPGPRPLPTTHTSPAPQPHRGAVEIPD